MLNAFFHRLDVTEHHGRTRFQAEFVRDLHHFQPLVRIALERRDFLAHAVDQNLTASARNRAEPGFFEF